jgi:hypothetical protein
VPKGHDHQAKQRKGATNRCSAPRAIVWPVPVTMPCAARPADPSPLRRLEIETFSIAPVGHNIVCHGGKHAIAQRLVANRRSADTRDGGALVARRRRHSSLCAHTVIIPRIGTNTCGWAASGLSETESLIPEREAKGPGARVLSAPTRQDLAGPNRHALGSNRRFQVVSAVARAF